MFTIKSVRVLTCEEKPWEVNGKKGFFYPTAIRIDGQIFNITSKLMLEADTDYDLEFEFQSKTPKQGAAYTGVRITGIVD